MIFSAFCLLTPCLTLPSSFLWILWLTCATVFFVFIEICSFRDSRNIQKLHHHHTTIFCQVRLPSGNIWYLLVEMLVKQWCRHLFPYNDAVSEQEHIPLIRTVRYLQTRRWHTTCCGPSQLWPFLGPSWSSTPSAMRHDPRRYMTWCDAYENAWLHHVGIVCKSRIRSRCKSDCPSSNYCDCCPQQQTQRQVAWLWVLRLQPLKCELKFDLAISPSGSYSCIGTSRRSHRWT